LKATLDAGHHFRDVIRTHFDLVVKRRKRDAALSKTPRGLAPDIADHLVYSGFAQPQTASLRSRPVRVLGKRAIVPAGACPTSASLYSKPMIDSLIGVCEALVSVIAGKDPGPTSRISRVGMPNGFFLNDLLWFGDGASRKTAISRGFTVEPGESAPLALRS
jgi:hypothetical protein